MTRRNLLLSAAVLVVLLIVAGVVAVRGRRSAPSTAPQQAALPDWIQVYFTTPLGKGKQAPSGSPARLDEHLTAVLDGARRTIDMAIYDLELDNVTDALLRAQKRGVRVRIVTDTDNLGNTAVQRAVSGGIPVVDDKRGAIMHNKFAVIDGEQVWMGSWNFTPNDTFQYNNNGALIHSTELAENYTAEFDKMFVQRKFGPTKAKQVPHPRMEIDGTPVENVFESEGDAPARIVDRIKGAKESVVFLAFTFTDDRIGEAMEERARAGVKVRGVFETLQSDRPESELGRFRRDGMDKDEPSGFPRAGCAAGPGVLTDGNPQLMHHKVIVIDGSTVIFGSFNFTRNAADDNDENLLIIDNPAVATAFLDEFCRVYNTAVEKTPKK
jgi:phosphatidylserine/phosphatidylglycerophosphate/cardiolipin synthase-like enzyme